MGEGTKSHVSLCIMTYADDVTTYNVKSCSLEKHKGKEDNDKDISGIVGTIIRMFLFDYIQMILRKSNNLCSF